MSMVIDALRLGVVEALAADPVIAGIVGNRVLDSRMEAYSDGEPVPIISVYTEEDKGPAWSENNGGPPFNLTVNLTIEIMFQVRAFSDDGQPVIGVAVTNRETEAMLGLLRSRCTEVIVVGDSAWSKLLRHHVIRRVSAVESKRLKSDDTASRTAFRTIMLSIEIKDDDDDTVAVAPFEALPSALAAVCVAMPQGSSGYQTCVLMNSALQPASPAVPPVYLEHVGMVLRPGPKITGDEWQAEPNDQAQFSAEAVIFQTP